MKLGAYETFACEPCLEEYREYVEKATRKS